jgi:formate dehydrogenase subunit gamma
MRARLVAARCLIAGALCLSFALAAGAQTPSPAPAAPATSATPAPDANAAKAKPTMTYGVDDEATAQQQQQLVQPLNNKPVWDIVRSGVPQTTTVRGRETNVLIQPEGQTWRALRNSQLSFWGGGLIVAIFLAITAFYVIKGAIPLHAPRTGVQIRRFTPWERSIHWTTAYAFVALAISGLIILFGKNILLPLIGYTLFSWLTILAKNLHNFIGPLFVVCLVLIFATFLRDNGWRAYDWIWVRRFGGLFKGHDVPSGKFNAGEKLWFWFGVLLLGIVVGASGLVLDFPNFNQTRETMQIANVIHIIGASLFIAMGLGHIYMGTLGMVGAYDAMATGYVDETWAREHHLYWYNDLRERGALEPEGDLTAAPRPA